MKRPPIDEIRKRVEAARLGPWITKDYMDKSQVGRDWELADFGECGHHNRKVWMTTKDQPASMSNGACPCEDADFCAHSRQDIPALLAYVGELERDIKKLVYWCLKGGEISHARASQFLRIDPCDLDDEKLRAEAFPEGSA